jgi:S-adenosylmethionine uptake transporter
MYRGVIGVIFMCCFISLRGGSFGTHLPWQHLWRGVVGVTALSLWFYSIGRLPLTTAMTLNYMAPIWMAAILFGLAWWRGSQRFEWGLATAIVLSFAGVVMLLRPSFQADQWFAGLLGLFSGMLSAVAYLQVRRLGQLGEPEYRVVFYFSVTGLVAGLVGTLLLPAVEGGTSLNWHHHSGLGIALLMAVGVSATIAQMAMTRAYRLGKTLVTANLQYSGIVFSSFWGILIWSEVLDWSGWLGIGIILASGVAATFYNAREMKSAGVSIVSDPIATECS